MRLVQDDYSLMKLDLAVLFAQASKTESRWCRSLTGLHCGSNSAAPGEASFVFVCVRAGERE